jgi:hypothetical protein
MEEHLGSQRTSQFVTEMLADILKPQAAFRVLGDTISRGSTGFCGLGESTEPLATSPVPPLGDELPNPETVFWTQQLATFWLMSL